MADLLESAVAAAHPDRISARLDDRTQYRLPLDRWSGLKPVDQNPSGIQWTPGFTRAYEDGYDPLLWIGRGASAEVWRCVDRAFGREVAIKIPALQPGQDNTRAALALQDEAELLGRLQHPGIVQAVRFTGDGQATYLALDFVDGDDIVQHCRQLKLDLPGRLSLFIRALDAVAYLHTKGIVHGDIKSEHVLVREDDQPVLIDFGLSSSDSATNLALDDPRRVGGSGMYRAPEIASGEASSPDPTHDVYSLGIILQELILDFESESIDDQIDLVMRRAIREDSDQRWPDAGAMLEALQQAIASRELQDLEHTSGPQPAAAQQPPANTFRTLAIAASLFLLLSAVVWLAAFPPGSNATAQRETSSDESAPRAAAQASFIELNLGKIYSGETEQPRKEIEEMINQDPSQAEKWEVRHLESMLEGKGEAFPLGQSPFGNTHAICTDFDQSTNTLVYVILDQGRHQLWAQSFDFEPRLIGEQTQTIRAVAVSPGADQLASLDRSGRVKLWSLDDAAGVVGEETNLPEQPDARAIWFGPGGDHLFFFTPKARTVQCWSVDLPAPEEPLYTLDECDHAYPMPSSTEAFMIATRDEAVNDGFTTLKLIDAAQGDVMREFELTFEQLPVSVDTGLDEDSALCLGMPDGFVWIHDPEHGGWQMHCDLGHNAPVTSVVYSEEEKRVFASLSRVHVIDTEGNLLTRLGDRKAPTQLVTQLSFEEDSDTLTVVSHTGIRRCIAE